MGLINYPGLMLTTIQLSNLSEEKDRSQLEHGDNVRFSEKDKNATSEKAAFLNNIVEVEDGVFTAKFVSNEEAANIAREDEERTTLFCVHGLSVEAGDKLGRMFEALKLFEKKNVYYPIPVIWASQGAVLSYFEDRNKYALEGGAILRTLTEDVPNGNFGKISLMCHSMGNHLVFNHSDAMLSEGGDPEKPKVEFQNIFMVAADVPGDIFTEEPKKGLFGMGSPHTREKAENMKNMLASDEEGKPIGKIYVLYNTKDIALRVSKYINFLNNFIQKRLGASGAYKIRQEFEGFVMNFDTTELFDSDETQDPKDRFIHSYHYYDWAVDFYNSVHSKDKDRSPEDRVKSPDVYDPTESDGLFGKISDLLGCMKK